jgi:tetratricopeptide (TPR) repeat protein
VLDRESAESLITEPSAGTLPIRRDAVNRLLDLTTGHPYFLQLICYELFERAMRADRAEITAEDIDDDVLAATMELGMGGLAWFWDEFPPAERFILSAIAHLTREGQPATLRQIGQALREHGVRLQGMELSTAPMVLAEWEIIEAAGRDAYRFRVEFLRRWILSKHSLEEAKRELEQVSARAVRLYESARRLHESGDLGGAIDEYRRALAANPNHARAQLGLAQARYESGRIELAVEAFEKAYRLDPESARDGLVAAHRDLGTSLENEGHFDQARPHFLRVLDLTPDDPAARLRMRDSWRATAGAHLAAGRWDKAAESYREALRYAPDDVHLQQAVATLEQRQIEAEAVQRRRQQLERAVLESRLREERTRRRELQAATQQALPILVVVSAGAGAVSALAAAAGTEALTSGLWPIVVAVSLVVVYATYAWTTRNLS